MSYIFINGKFTAQRTTGVQRLALGIVKALDNHFSGNSYRERFVLLCPHGSTPPLLTNIEVRFIGYKDVELHLWEQIILPIYTFGSTLINLSGPAPLFKINQVCMIPDAAVFDHSEAYTVSFSTWYRFLFIILSRSARLLLTISEFSSQRLKSVLFLKKDRFRVLPCAASHIKEINPDFSIIERHKLTEKPFLLSVGSSNPTKNLMRLIHAFNGLNRDVSLVIVGGSNSTVFADHKTGFEYEDRIINIGVINDAQLRALYSCALAFVFPSVYEGFGLPLLEAMLLRCPVLTSNVASMPEVCGNAALYFNPYSISDIRVKLETIVDNNKVRNELVILGEERVKYFTWNTTSLLLVAYLTNANIMREVLA